MQELANGLLFSSTKTIPFEEKNSIVYITEPFLDGDIIQQVEEWFEEPETQSLLFPVGNENSRRVIQFGESYSYDSKRSEVIEPFPDIIQELADRAYQELVGRNPHQKPYGQCIINRYLPGEGIGGHIDLVSAFGDFIACYTFGCGREMEFDTKPPTRLYTVPGSLYVMSGASRYRFKHQMRARKTDKFGGETYPRGICFSVTFRSLE